MGGVIDRMILEREKMAEGGVLPFVIVIVFIVFFIPPPLPLHPIPPAIGSRRDGDGESRDENERRGRLVGGGGGGDSKHGVNDVGHVRQWRGGWEDLAT